jgi:hypothetical protein
MYSSGEILFMSEYICKLCVGQDFGCYESLRRHSSRVHKIKSQQFYVDFYLKGEWPKCACGCGKKVKWCYVAKNFRHYCAGHQSRIKNNWGHNPEAIAKSSETRRKQFDSGERTVWNVGLTKETDERVKNNVVSLVAFSKTPEERKVRSDRMKKGRLAGTIRTLRGSEHSRWNGGTSRLRDMIYADVRLYKEWKYPILEKCDFKCVECGKGGNLHVHHNKEKMCDIVKKHIPTDTTDEMLHDFNIKRKLSDDVVDYHIQNKVSGITLCDKCHKKYHPSLNLP